MEVAKVGMHVFLFSLAGIGRDFPYSTQICVLDGDFPHSTRIQAYYVEIFYLI